MAKLCPYKVLLIATVLATSCSAEVMFINDGESLVKYLCPPSGTISPNTKLELNKSSFTIDGQSLSCQIENTSNITVVPSQELIINGHDHVEVQCLPGSGGFGFFNVSNLTISSVMFNNCAGVIPASAVRYVNDTDQYLFYGHDDLRAAFIFNHCYNITLHNLISMQNDSKFSIIGVNMCDHSSINIVTTVVVSGMKNLLYYADSVLTSSNLVCNLNIEYNPTLKISSSTKETYYIHGDKMPISLINGWFTLVVSQQEFDANVDMVMKPTAFSSIWISPLLAVSIMFINSMANSQVTFQGLPYEYCKNDTSLDHYFMSLALNVLYYETPSFNSSVSGVRNSLVIQNTSFLLYTTSEINSVKSLAQSLLQIGKDSKTISHQIKVENVSWCMKDLDSDSIDPSSNIGPYHSLLTAENLLNQDMSSTLNKGNLHISITNTHMHYHGLSPRSLTAIILKNINIAMSGTNYFALNGGAIMKIEASNLTITGNLTVSGAHTIRGGGLSLDEQSTLYLKEPLTACFYNNTAYQASALYAPISKKNPNSTIQILPRSTYTLLNIEDIEIALHFKNNTDYTGVPNSLYVPSLNFNFLQVSPNLQFQSLDWDSIHTQFAYTTLFDVVLKEIDEFDKYTSLANGMCIQLHGQQWNCKYTDSVISHREDYVSTFHTFPGETAISILYTNNEIFSVQQVSSCSGDKLMFVRDLDSLLRTNSYYATKTVIFENKEGKSVCFILYRYNQILNLQFFVHVDAYCPLGFHLTEEGYCNCTSALRSHKYVCDINTRVFSSPPGYWTGYEEYSPDTSQLTLFFTTNCPPNYCDPNFQHFVLNNSITDLSCLNSRTGIICGQCMENYSAVFGSDTCYSNCNDLYLLTLPMYALAGLILVVVLSALRLTVATGTINGVIFYANILGLSMDKMTQDYHGQYLTFFHIVISLLNLNLGFPICFYKGMTTTARVGLQFIFPVYLWSIVVGMIIVSKCSLRISKLLSNSSVQVLATLFYLSFSKLLCTVIDIISYSELYSITYINHNYSQVSEKMVWYYSGDDYGHGVHGFYLALATIFIALFLLPYTILVTFSHCFMRFKIVNKFKPFIDAYGGPFKDKWRFWFGLRLWITITLFIVNGVLQGTNDTTLQIHVVIFIVFIIFQAILHPFKNLIVGFVDTLVMTDYWLIIMSYLIFKSIFQGAYILLLSAYLLVLLLIFLFHFYYEYIHQKVSFKIKAKLYNKYTIIQDEQDDAELFQAAEQRYQATHYSY